jgi:hypothetical protein
MKFCKNKYFIENLQLSWILAEDTQSPPRRQSVRELKHPGLRFPNYMMISKSRGNRKRNFCKEDRGEDWSTQTEKY